METPAHTGLLPNILPGASLDGVSEVYVGPFINTPAKPEPLLFMFKGVDSKTFDPKEFAGKVRHPRFGMFHNEDGSDIWVTKDIDDHGGSAWKTYKKVGNKLEWQFDADEYMNKIESKHR